MNRYYIVKAGLIGAALCVAILGSSMQTQPSQMRLSHSPFTAADTVQAGIYRTGARLGHVALGLFYFAR